MKKRSFTARLNNATEGLISIFKDHRNMKLHLLMGVLVFGTGVFLGLDRIELVILIAVIGLILFAEMINSSMEMMIDFYHPDFHPVLKRIKDALAGTVLFMGIVSFAIIYFLFSPYLDPSLQNGFQRLKGAHWPITFLTFSVISAVVIITKTFFKKGTPFRGGIPSGHAAMAFSIWTMVTLMEANPLLSILIFILAVMIAGSRLKEGIHNIWEIILGGFVGFLITLTIFQIFGF
ncbi:MAG: diacylglycerol kinase [Candidatus Saelkia tenebricola]|nr:diacylglycerol kinase [Candidatus Saelkia tenebricola]